MGLRIIPRGRTYDTITFLFNLLLTKRNIKNIHYQICAQTQLLLGYVNGTVGIAFYWRHPKALSGPQKLGYIHQPLSPRSLVTYLAGVEARRPCQHICYKKRCLSSDQTPCGSHRPADVSAGVHTRVYL